MFHLETRTLLLEVPLRHQQAVLQRGRQRCLAHHIKISAHFSKLVKLYQKRQVGLDMPTQFWVRLSILHSDAGPALQASGIPSKDNASLLHNLGKSPMADSIVAVDVAASAVEVVTSAAGPASSQVMMSEGPNLLSPSQEMPFSVSSSLGGNSEIPHGSSPSTKLLASPLAKIILEKQDNASP
ncbi:unnamed protein product [Linum trigynum]|uniref:Uncharacterized protein n=1 Tax=Linum trigynum TaxID=586398 RepID=A0AAV2G481_9ROSI